MLHSREQYTTTQRCSSRKETHCQVLETHETLVSRWKGCAHHGMPVAVLYCEIVTWGFTDFLDLILVEYL